MQMLRAATITVSDVDAAAATYAAWFGYRVVERGHVAPDLAASWDCPASAEAAMAVLQPASLEPVFIRLIAGQRVPAYTPMRTYGWAAMELCVADVLAVQESLRMSPFAIVGPAQELVGLPAILPMQVRGPDQEMIYLTQVRDDMPDYDLPRAACTVDRPFIMVLACSNMAASAAWFASTLGLTMGQPFAIPYAVLADAFGTLPETLFSLCTMSDERDVFLELDQYPSEAAHRPTHAGALPPGLAIATFLHSDTGSIEANWLSPPQARAGIIYAGGIAGMLRAPDGSLVEILGLP